MHRAARVSVSDSLHSLLFLLVLAFILTACSGGRSSSVTSLSTVTMTALSPSSVTLESNQQAQFSVSVSGASNTDLVWDIVDSSGRKHLTGDATVGTVTQSGLYTAPVVSVATDLTLLVGAAADTSIQRSATIHITPLPPPVGITISPTSASVQTCTVSPCPALSMVDFSAHVTNASDISVQWQVNGLSGGSHSVGLISATGVYTAPATVPNPATVTVTAEANADPTKTAPAQVTITPAPPPIKVNLNATSVTLVAGQSFDFIATDNQGHPLSVTYAVSCSTTDCGSTTPTGTGNATYTAPSAVPNDANLSVTVTATSTADTTKTASADVTVKPPIAPSVEIDFANTVLHPNDTVLLTAKVNNLPTGDPTPVFNWTQSPTTFCVSSDEEGSPGEDNCADNDGDPTPELDGPGRVNTIAGDNPQAIYVAPQVIWNSSNGGIFYPNGCSQATAAQTYVYITVSTVVDSVQLSSHACVQVSP
jgi:hypothetical protein